MDLFGQTVTRKRMKKNELQYYNKTAFFGKISRKEKRGYKTPGKNRLLSWQRQLSHNNKRKLCALDVTNNYIERLVLFLLKPVFNNLIWKNSRLRAVSLFSWSIEQNAQDTRD